MELQTFTKIPIILILYVERKHIITPMTMPGHRVTT